MNKEEKILYLVNQIESEIGDLEKKVNAINKAVEIKISEIKKQKSPKKSSDPFYRSSKSTVQTDKDTKPDYLAISSSHRPSREKPKTQKRTEKRHNSPPKAEPDNAIPRVKPKKRSVSVKKFRPNIVPC